MSNRRFHRRGLSTTAAAIMAGAAVVVGIAVVLSRSGPDDQATIEADIHVVTVGDFDITIPASGELAAAEQIEVRCLVDGASAITEIIDEGTPVEPGTVLMRLDEQEVRERIESSEEQLVEAQNRLEANTASLAIAEKSRESSLAAATVAVDQARLALLAWQEGEVVSRRNELSLAVRTAEKDYNRLADKYAKSLDLRERDFISQNDLEQDEIAMIRAEASLSKARLEKEVYEKYTYQKDEQLKKSNLKQTEDELVRVETRTAASVRSARSDLVAAETALAARLERIARYREQLAACTVTAPAAGMVVYGTTLGRNRRDLEESFRVGSMIRRNELLFVLPDTSQMIADVNVNEALSGLVKPGQPALVRMDAFPDELLQGDVQSVGVLAKDGGWRDPNRRDYSVIIDLGTTGELPLKPSMRCKAEILVESVTQVRSIPVQAVHRQGRATYVHVNDDGQWEARLITLGRSSELFVEITDGLDEGAQVLLRDPPPGTVSLTIEDVLAEASDDAR